MSRNCQTTAEMNRQMNAPHQSHELQPAYELQPSHEPHLIQNPVIAGFYPDPSICRVGDDYYLACSSFELYPGIPLFHSRDLAHWEPLGGAMTIENGFHVTANMFTGGVMAPTLRCHDGLFYLICCNFADKGNFYVTAADPRGPWSKPHWLEDIPDLDCSFFFDADGRSWLVFPGSDEQEDNGRAIFLQEYDLTADCAVGGKKKIWNSALRKAWAPEAPHIYHIGDWYYLMIAEGGTEHFHAVTVARSRTVDGFYDGFDGNPVMTHRHLGLAYPIDNVGHADLVDTPDGRWYAVMLGSRLIEGPHKNMGRETFLVPVRWEQDWPVFSPGTGKVEWTYPADPSLPWTPCRKSSSVFPQEAVRESSAPELPRMPIPETDTREHFPGGSLGPEWCFWGTPYQDFWKQGPDGLRLSCLPRPVTRKLTGFQPGVIDERRDDCVSFIGRRQTDIAFSVTFSMDFAPENHETAGLLLMQAANHQYRFERFLSADGPALRLVLITTEQFGRPYLPGYRAETTEQVLFERCNDGGPVILRLEARGQDYCFFAGPSEDQLTPCYLHADGRAVNPESVGGMVGTVLGMFASSNGEPSTNAAHFAWFDYRPLDCKTNSGIDSPPDCETNPGIDSPPDCETDLGAGRKNI